MTLSNDLSAVLTKFITELREGSPKIKKYTQDLFTYALFFRIYLQMNQQ